MTSPYEFDPMENRPSGFVLFFGNFFAIISKAAISCHFSLLIDVSMENVECRTQNIWYATPDMAWSVCDVVT